ncbi:hypothetical protein ACXO3S_07950 [Lactobacillus delbrueckii subsp. bulgaricus]
MENHDVVRAHGMIDDPAALRAMTAFIYFMKGGHAGLQWGRKGGCPPRAPV